MMVSLEYLCVATASLITAVWAGDQVIGMTTELAEHQKNSLRENLRRHRPHSHPQTPQSPTTTQNRHTTELLP